MLLTLLVSCPNSLVKDALRDQARRENPEHFIGIGEGLTEAEANKSAQNELMGQIEALRGQICQLGGAEIVRSFDKDARHYVVLKLSRSRAEEVAMRITDERAVFEQEVDKLREARKAAFLLAVGDGESRDLANRRAYLELAGQVISRVVSETNLFVSESIKKMKEEVKASLVYEQSSHASTVSSHVCLKGAEIVKRHLNSCGQHQTVVSFPRKNIEASLECTQKQIHKQKRKKLTTLSVRYEYSPTNHGGFQFFGDGDVLHSGDFYRLIVKSSEDVYMYIFQFDSANQMYRLFPKGEFEGEDIGNINPVNRGVRYYVPRQNKWYVLDNQLGMESIYIVVSQKKDTLLYWKIIIINSHHFKTV